MLFTISGVVLMFLLAPGMFVFLALSVLVLINPPANAPWVRRFMGFIERYSRLGVGLSLAAMIIIIVRMAVLFH